MQSGFRDVFTFHEILLLRVPSFLIYICLQSLIVLVYKQIIRKPRLVMFGITAIAVREDQLCFQLYPELRTTVGLKTMLRHVWRFDTPVIKPPLTKSRFHVSASLAISLSLRQTVDLSTIKGLSSQSAHTNDNQAMYWYGCKWSTTRVIRNAKRNT